MFVLYYTVKKMGEDSFLVRVPLDQQENETQARDEAQGRFVQVWTEKAKNGVSVTDPVFSTEARLKVALSLPG